MRWRQRHESDGGVRDMTALAVCLSAWMAIAAPARGDQPPVTASGTATIGSGTVPYWQAPALPSAVIQGGAIPAGWQPQAVPYRGVGPDGRPITMYFAPTYVFTYQSGPPVLAVPPVNRRPPAAVPTYGPAGASGWNYQAQGAAAVPVSLPPATVARYQPAPYQFPADARALSGTPIVPPATPLPGPPLPGPPPVSPSPPPPPYGSAPAQQIAPPPQQWVPSSAPPPPGMAPAAGDGWAAAAPVAAATVPLAAAAVATAPNPPPTVSLSQPPVPISTGGTPVAAASSPSSAAPPPPGASATNTHVWRVVGVNDGDTVTCIDEANQQQKIRLAEIDAPEVSQDFGKVSREALAGMVFGKTVQVVDDGKDRYGRWIGHLYVDGLDVNRQMVATGMAWHYAAYSQDPSLGALQSQAQAQRIGLWSQPNPMPPWDYRKNAKKAA